MDPIQLEIQKLSASLLAEVNKSMESRDVALCDRLAKMIDEKNTALRAEILEKSRVHSVPGLSADAKEFKDFSLSRLIASHITKNPSIAGLELELCREAAQTIGRDMSGGMAWIGRDMATSVDTQIGYIVPMQVFSSRIIPLLQNRVSAFQLGATQFTGLSGSPVHFPKIAGPSTAYHVNHDTTTSPTAVTGSDMTVGQIEMTPKTVAAKSILSMRLAMLTSGAAERMVEQQIAKDIGLKQDAMAFNGSGASGEPRGILNVTGINSVASFGDPADATCYNKLIDMTSALAEDNALLGKLGWVMHSAVFRQIRKTIDATNQPQARRVLDTAPFTTLLGYPFIVTNNVPTNDLLFANWEDLYYGQWGSMQLFIDPLTVNGKLQIQILAALDYDWQVGHAESFCDTAGMTGAS